MLLYPDIGKSSHFVRWLNFSLTDHPYPLSAAMLTFTSLLYVEYYWVLTTYSTLLKRNYGYNDIQIGLCYL